MSYTTRTVSTKADIDKKIEIEAAHLMYMEFKKKEDAFREATNYIEAKFKEVVNELKQQGKY